ncbi:FAD binding domain-containing protein [Apiospora aurea]|uniref:FAD binding domain-containing protein n=1 Tax=Apiospora aurea TaxID=335848 RepID=A0ABR1QRG6_9PEZI
MRFPKPALCYIFFTSAARSHRSFASIDLHPAVFDAHTYDEELQLVDPAACKAAPGFSGWPTGEEWANYNKSVGGRLIQPFPPGGCAREHNVRVVVKSSGHDFQGRSTAPGALSIWIHHMQAIEARASSFRPRSCPFAIDENTVTVAGGTQTGAVYEELARINQTVVGGASKKVAVGGYLTGGGHSILAPRYGLGADQVLEMEVVTPMGNIVVANECQNQDLFWAMRGGGGSTFGVMTSVTMLTYPSPSMLRVYLYIAIPEAGKGWFWDMLGYVLSQFPYLERKGISGYSTVHPNMSVDVNGSKIHMSTIWEPILDHVRKTWPEAIIIPAPNITVFRTYLDYFHDAHDEGLFSGLDQYADSWLLDASSLAAAGPSELGQAFKALSSPSGYVTAFLVTGSGTRNAKPRGGGNAVSPAFRKSVVYATNGVTFPPLNARAREEALVQVNDAMEPLRKLSSGMGAYVNEDNPGRPDWQNEFWGENYDRLVQIKRAVDPEDVLWCHPCVGNERWREIGSRICRVGHAPEEIFQHNVLGLMGVLCWTVGEI